MASEDQTEFIGKIRTALGHPRSEPGIIKDLFVTEIPDESKAVLERIHSRGPTERAQLLDRLIAEAGPIKLNVIPKQDVTGVASAISDLVREKEPEWGVDKSVVAWRHPMIEQLDLGPTLSHQQIPVYFADNGERGDGFLPDLAEREAFRQSVIDSYIGITSADYLVADTATLVLRTRPGQPRMVSLVPSIHIAVVHLNQIVESLKELYALLKWAPDVQEEGLTNCMTFISGPSKTADIEATMVHGAHGPREVFLYVVSSPPLGLNISSG